MNYDVVIGLEIHVQLNTQTKMFCRCSASTWEAAPNSHVCPVCLGLPGALPVVNEEAIHKAIAAGYALQSEYNLDTYFERKHYFYPDLAKGYQISQLQKPICVGGAVRVGEEEIRLDRAHLEEDAGKLLHIKDIEGNYSLIDFNRSGMPLLEIVSKPELVSPAQASAYAKKVQQLMRYCGASEADMEKGSLRVDANISLKPSGAEILGTKVEVKNMNSFRSLERALLYEVARQTELLTNGERVHQETRGWVETKGETVSQRSKEEAHDYRYFPDPDIPSIHLEQELIENLTSSLPEMPDEKVVRLGKEYTLSKEQSALMASDPELAAWYEEAVKAYTGTSASFDAQKSKEVYNWVANDVLRHVSASGVPFSQIKLLPAQLAEILYLRDSGEITISAARHVFEKVFATGESVAHVVAAEGLKTVQDLSTLEKYVDQILLENPAAVADYKAGKTQIIGFFIGSFQKKSGASVNPADIQKLFREKIEKSDT